MYLLFNLHIFSKQLYSYAEPAVAKATDNRITVQLQYSTLAFCQAETQNIISVFLSNLQQPQAVCSTPK